MSLTSNLNTIMVTTVITGYSIKADPMKEQLVGILVLSPDV